MPAGLPSIHHVTAITADVQRDVDFYVGVLGLRFIKRTVNFDVPNTYHLYFGDRVGTPGTAMTFFGWPHLPTGPQGAGQVLAVSFQVPSTSLDFWRRRRRDGRAHGLVCKAGTWYLLASVGGQPRVYRVSRIGRRAAADRALRRRRRRGTTAVPRRRSPGRLAV